MEGRLSKTIMAGAAVMALVAAPLALAQGNGNGNRGGGGGGGKAEQSQRGGGGGQTRGGGNRGGGGEARGNRGGGGGNADRGNRGGGEARGNRGNGNGGGNASQGNGNRGNERAGGNANSNRGNGGGNGNAFRSNGNGNRGNAGGGRGDRNRGGSLIDLDVDFALPALRQSFGVAPRIIDGCPPGLAKKRNGCLPPGRARQRYRSYDPGFFGLFGADRGNYFYDGGYLLRYGGDGLAGYIPLLGGALGLGQTWPSFYEPQPLPNYYRDYYRLGDQRGYRYADNVIYRVEPESAAILGVAALLTGDDITIGSPMPRGYDVYNVPYGYRDLYYDRPGRNYRYADGYIYEIDTETALVLSAIRLAS